MSSIPSPLQPVVDVTGDVIAPLLAAARAGDRPAFGQLVRLLQARAFSLALRFCGRRDEAEEVAQDAFLQLHAQLASIDGHLHLRHWLSRTIVHRSIDRLRRRGREPQGEPAALELEAVADESDLLLRRRLRELLLQLPEAARAVMLLRYQEDLDPPDIAAALGMPLNTVKSHLRRSLEWLRLQDVEGLQ